MTKKEKEALQDYIEYEKESGRIPSLDMAVYWSVGYCGYLKGFANEFKKALKERGIENGN